MEVTLQDIADELNVSVMTVSRSLRSDKAINPETRARVSEAAHRLGYKSRVRRPRRPVEQKPHTRTLGLLIRHGNLQQVQHDTNLMKMMTGIMTVTDKHEMHFKVHPWPQHDGNLEEDASLLPPMILDGQCQALIVQGAHDERDLAFLAHRLPVVSMGRIYRGLPIDAAVADNVEGVHELVKHLVDLGHRRLTWVGAPYDATFLQSRKLGFMQGCMAHGLEFDEHSFFGPKSYRGGEIDRDAVLRALEAGVTGWVCGNDGTAVSMITVLEALGRRVPEDVSVTGFDTSKPLQPGSRRLPTSIDPYFYEIGQVAARMALQRLENPMTQPCITSIGGTLVPGDSTGPAPDLKA